MLCYMFIFVSIMHMIDCIAAPDEVSSKDYVSVRKSIKYVMLYILKNICVTQNTSKNNFFEQLTHPTDMGQN